MKLYLAWRSNEHGKLPKEHATWGCHECDR